MFARHRYRPVHRLGQNDAGASQAPVSPAQVGRLARCVDARGDRLARGVDIKGGKLVGAVAHHGDAFGFEDFQRPGNIENALRPCTNDGNGGAGELGQIGGDIPGMRVAMGAADAPRREQPNASQMGNRHGGGTADGCGREFYCEG